MIPRPPVVVVLRDPLAGPRPGDVYEVPVGATIADLAPDTAGRPLVCSMAGTEGYLLRRDWVHPVQPGDIVLFHVDPPQDRESLPGILQAVLAVVAIVFYIPPVWLFVGNVAINLLLPVAEAQTIEAKNASPTYNTSLSGNIARLDQPIPRICGRHKITPPFAAQPYMQFDANGDQYYYALFAVGIGNHGIERALIDDTDLRHFADVVVNKYLPPGTPTTTVLANVATAPEVAGQDVTTSRYVGGFAACAPRKKATHIGIDIVAPRGLGVAGDDGSIGMSTLEWRVEVRALDDFGAAMTPWTPLASESRSASTTKVQRWSFTYELPVPIRPEIRLVRTNAFNDNARWLNDMQWAGMRAYLEEAAPLHPDAAHYEVVLRASDQLSSLSQRNISLIVQAHTRTWDPIGGWGSEVHTRNPAWWLADLWSSGVWGEGLPDSRIDLLTLYELSLIWEARQDRFDFVFDTSMDAWEAAQLIAGAGRARVFRRYGVNTLARDQLETLPVTAFTPRNCAPDSMSLDEALPTRDTADGVIIEYFDNRLWDWLPIECPCPGVGAMDNPVRKRKPGITGAKHAEREGIYEAASMFYRTRRAVCVTEMQGMLPAYMSPVRWQPEVVGYGQSGDVAHWDEAELVMGLTEPVIWGALPNYLTLIRDDGTLTEPVLVTPGPSDRDVVLTAAPDFDLVLDDAMRERPKYLLGPIETCDELVKISAISDGGKTEEAQMYNIEAVVDDARVHAADNALLPGPGDIQDPIDPVVIPPEQYFVNIGNSDGFYAPENNAPINSHSFGSDGVERIVIKPGFDTVALASQWLIGSPVEPGVGELFEIFVTSSVPLSVASSATGVWLSLGITRLFETDPDIAATINVQIREVATGIVQGTATKVLQ